MESRPCRVGWCDPFRIGRIVVVSEWTDALEDRNAELEGHVATARVNVEVANHEAEDADRDKREAWTERKQIQDHYDELVRRLGLPIGTAPQAVEVRVVAMWDALHSAYDGLVHRLPGSCLYNASIAEVKALIGDDPDGD